MKKIMILGANTLQLPLIQQAKKDNYQVVVASPNKDEPGFLHADTAVYADLRDQESLLKAALENNIDGVITDQTDIPVRAAAYIAEKMNLPGIGYETAKLFTDKYLMREKCKELGVKTLAYKLVHTLQEAIEFFHSLNTEVIIKPVDNQGSKGVTKISSEPELIQYFSEALSYSVNGVLIEEFVTGEEFVAEGLVYNYQFSNLNCGDTFYFDIPNVFSATTRVFPSTRDNQLVERVKQLNKKIIEGFKLKQGITHSEFIVSNDEIYLIETAARGGGVFISSDLIPLSCGVHTEKFLLEIATGSLKQAPSVLPSKKACCYVAFFLPEGKIVTAGGIEQINELPYTHRNNLDNIYIGKHTPPFTDKTARYFIILSADCHKELNQYVKNIQQLLTIEVITEKGIEGPIWK